MSDNGFAGDAAPFTDRFTVLGMTCAHCVAAVTDEVSSGVPGVLAVRVDLATGALTVSGSMPIDGDAVRAAVEEAGYAVDAGR